MASFIGNSSRRFTKKIVLLYLATRERMGEGDEEAQIKTAMSGRKGAKNNSGECTPPLSAKLSKCIHFVKN